MAPEDNCVARMVAAVASKYSSEADALFCAQEVLMTGVLYGLCGRGPDGAVTLAQVELNRYGSVLK